MGDTFLRRCLVRPDDDVVVFFLSRRRRDVWILGR